MFSRIYYSSVWKISRFYRNQSLYNSERLLSCRRKIYALYIYTVDQLKKFFVETDQCKYSCEFPFRHHIMPVIFCMIYMCGLRASEARLLKVADVDLRNGILTINCSKKDNSRLIPMSDVLISFCRNFSKKVHPNSAAEDYYFPALGRKPMRICNLYNNFRRFLWRAKISHGGRGKGPRIHDLRYPNLNKIQTFVNNN